MAEINTAATGTRRAGVRQSKKLSTRVDLTPMVDLGFLLITFFIFSSKLSEPKEMELKMPADKNIIDSNNVAKSAALTVVLLDKDKIFYYHGILAEALQTGAFGSTNYSVEEGIGQVIRNKQLAMDRAKPGSRKDLMLMIKPTPGANYQNMVDLLDEVLINGLKHYAIMDITATETQAATSHTP